MEPAKTLTSSSSIYFDNPESESLLILKKSSPTSKKVCFEYDFSGEHEKGDEKNWSVSEFLPVFNVDKKFYTPAFVLKMDKVLLSRYSE